MQIQEMCMYGHFSISILQQWINMHTLLPHIKISKQSDTFKFKNKALELITSELMAKISFVIDTK